MGKSKVVFRVGVPGDGMTYVKCCLPCEIYSRVTGYFRPVSMWNTGKKQEFKDRKNYEVGAGVSEIYPLESSPVSTFQKR